MIERLQHCALFAGITQQEIEALLGCLRPVRRTYPKDAVIWHEGERVQSVGLVLSGRAVIRAMTSGAIEYFGRVC
ncbi:MAG: hypothetical protein ACLUB2_05655 [Butyricicoccus pullicaecorum]